MSNTLQTRHGLIVPLLALVTLGLMLALITRPSGCAGSERFVVRLSGSGGSGGLGGASSSSSSSSAGAAGAGAGAGRKCESSTVYESSEYESTWLKNAAAWSKDFCKHADTPEQNELMEKWLNGIASANKKPAEAPAGLDPSVFSKFVTTVKCDDGTSSEHTDWIEPLAHGLRHPYNFCSQNKFAPSEVYTDRVVAVIYNRTYLLLANRQGVDSVRGARGDCERRECQVFFFDLGATAYRQSDKEPGQSWFVRSYAAAGLPFDRMFEWEARAMSPAEIFNEVPKELLKVYSYFNIPATTDTKDPSHAVNILKSLAKPGDFVVFKLDIDAAAVEIPILKALTEDPEAVKLVDEFFFEHHVNFPPMRPYWGGTLDEGIGLAESMQLFLEIRKKGVRAHSWV
ncbi:hypothetical protein Rsub_06806 [Raphidocelis subcapitata]|uniref:Uncharacterized protein n=1 Tax=Raphidocelis subcapitata TaxID=307507 RepID=A0A2V0P754_9CHLO|nr:hypothetical protein Rsub_06806 [Raphidocelis subcapitata]|eukprot:GBF93703.1 hypothetical protein Rsub_06806 [Raphidocelis subcapitata]